MLSFTPIWQQKEGKPAVFLHSEKPEVLSFGFFNLFQLKLTHFFRTFVLYCFT